VTRTGYARYQKRTQLDIAQDMNPTRAEKSESMHVVTSPDSLNLHPFAHPDALIAVVSVIEEIIAASNGSFPYGNGEEGGSMIAILRVFRLTRIGRSLRIIRRVKALDKMLKVRCVAGIPCATTALCTLRPALHKPCYTPRATRYALRATPRPPVLPHLIKPPHPPHPNEFPRSSSAR
jgi:hypothetical protein